MRHALLRLTLGLLALLAPAKTKDWPAIPPETWAIKRDAGQGAKGAVILDKWVRYGVLETEVRMRVRIFSEEGKGAAAIPAFSRFYEVEGRTVLPDGDVTPFDKAKDLVTGSMKVRGWESKQESLIPPGVTSDCVVDLHYRAPTQLQWTWLEIPILEAFPVRRKVMEMGATSSLSSALLGLKGLKAEKKQSGTYNVYAFTDLPPDETEPYALVTTGEHPRFVFFSQPRILDEASVKGPEAYWKEVGEKFYKPIYTKNMSFGSTYKEWSRTIREGVQGDSAAKATTILARLAEQILNESHLTRAEFAAMTKAVAEDRPSPQDLDLTVKRKRTNGAGMHYILYQLLVDEGLDPQLLLVADRKNRFFRYQLPNLYQFNEMLIGVAAQNGTFVWFEPSSRFFPAGLVRPDYQGTQGLLLNPKDWSCKPFTMGSQGANANRNVYDYKLDLGEEESFSLHARFLGYPEFQERSKYLALEPKEQDRKLKEEMESNLKAYTLTKVAVDNATDGRKNLEWTIEGKKEAEEGRRRSFSPFPGLSYPLFIPEAWPETRKSTIVLPYCRQFGAFSKFKVPKGWRLGKDPDFIQANEFGSVSWQVKESGSGDEARVEVTYLVEVKRMYAPASSYVAFREFLGWIESASRRTLALDRQS